MTQWGLDALFNPAKRHMDEEKRRLQATREQIGDSSGGKRIDLDSGKVRITRAKPVDEAGDETDVEPVEPVEPVEETGQSDGTDRSGGGDGPDAGSATDED